MTRSSTATYNLILSFIGLAIALFLASFAPSGVSGVSVDGKLLIGGPFIASCLFGISMAYKPGWYKRRGARESIASGDGGTRRGMSGHHPDCAPFEKHRVRFGGDSVCAGCLGIIIGSVLAIALMLAYVFAFQGSLKGPAQLLVAIGSAVIMLAYLEVAYQRRIVALHIAMSAAFIVGFFLVTVGITEATGSPIVGLLGVLFGFLWMNTRINLSNWRHAMLCGKCPEPCKSY